MSVKLTENNFLEGGIFFDVIVNKELPIPTEILTYLYGNCFQMGKLQQINLLKHIWKLKGVEMFKCLCQSHDHLVTKEEYFEQLSLQNPLKSEDFMENGQLHNFSLKTELPMDLLLLEHVWGRLTYFNQIPTGKCFKRDEYMLQLMKEASNLKYPHVEYFICTCEKHLNFFYNPI